MNAGRPAASLGPTGLPAPLPLRRPPAAWWWTVPLIVALGLSARAFGLDVAVADALFDATAGGFPWRGDAWLEAVGHHAAKSVVVWLWVATLAAAAFSGRVAELTPYRRVLWAIVAAMALGPTIVVTLKSVTTFPCPWSLPRYGGAVPEPAHWFTSRSFAGQCFPSGHSAGGFSLLAWPLAAWALGRRRGGWLLLLVAVACGVAFSVVRTLQGAHFVSHALWSAAIDWGAALLVFRAMLPAPEPGPALRPAATARR